MLNIRNFLVVFHYHYNYYCSSPKPLISISRQPTLVPWHEVGQGLLRHLHLGHRCCCRGLMRRRNPRRGRKRRHDPAPRFALMSFRMCVDEKMVEISNSFVALSWQFFHYYYYRYYYCEREEVISSRFRRRFFLAQDYRHRYEEEFEGKPVSTAQ